MKTIKQIIWIATLGFTAMQVSAQTKSVNDAAIEDGQHNSYHRIRNQDGTQIEQVEIWLHDKSYKVELAGDKITSLRIDDKTIPESDWNKYGEDIAAIREQIRLNRIQAKKNEEQARRNEIQAKKNQEQEQRNEVQAKKNQEQAVRNEEQAKRNELQHQRDEEQVRHNEEQDKLNAIQAQKNEEQAKRN